MVVNRVHRWRRVTLLFVGAVALVAPGVVGAAPLGPGVAPASAAIGPCNALHRNVAGMATVFATPAAVADESPAVDADPTGPAPDDVPDGSPLPGAAAMVAASVAAGTPAADAPVAPPAAPEPAGTPRLLAPELPAGEPAGEKAIAGLHKTMLRYFACANAGDAIGLISLVSDDFLRQSFANQPMTEADLRAYADTTEPLPLAERRRLVNVRETRQVTPGVYIALIDSAPLGNTDPAAVRTDLVTFVPDNHGNYLIDQFTSNVTLWYGPDATTAP